MNRAAGWPPIAVGCASATVPLRWTRRTSGNTLNIHIESATQLREHAVSPRASHSFQNPVSRLGSVLNPVIISVLRSHTAPSVTMVLDIDSIGDGVQTQWQSQL